MKECILVTGAAGFIGSHLLSSLIDSNDQEIIGIDNFCDSNGSNLPNFRADALYAKKGIRIKAVDIHDLSGMKQLLLNREVKAIIHLAAFPGVRDSQVNPFAYYHNNITGFGSILELVKVVKPGKFMFASSSSIYGDLALNRPVKETDATGVNLKSFYATTKWSNEMVAKSLQEFLKLPTLALRFFTVYGESGRPDMAYWHFTKKIVSGIPITLYGGDGGIRNFTYIDDAIKIIQSLIVHDLQGFVPINIATKIQTSPLVMANQIASQLNISNFKIISADRPRFDPIRTWADISYIESIGIKLPSTTFEMGISNFCSWYKEFSAQIFCKKLID